jgi:uncharacterized membrane protein YhaH (DUF805 family)
MADEWFYGDGQQVRGPVALEMLLAVLAARSDWKEIFVWREGRTDWGHAADVPEVSSYFRRPPPLPMPGVTQQPLAPPQEVSLPPSAAASPVAVQSKFREPNQERNESSRVVRVLRFLFSFYGRIGRSMYWLGMGVVQAMFAVTMLVWSNLQPSDVVSFVTGLWMFLWLASWFAIISKRLHDLSISGWWLAVAVAIGFVSAKSYLATQISSTIFGIGLILLGCFKGTNRPNDGRAKEAI